MSVQFEYIGRGGTSGLALAGAVVTATAAELNYLDITTLGTAAASKAMTWASNSSWTAAGGTCANLGTVTTVDILDSPVGQTDMDPTSQLRTQISQSHFSHNENVSAHEFVIDRFLEMGICCRCQMPCAAITCIRVAHRSAPCLILLW